MKTQIKIVKFWVSANYNQIFIILFLLYFLTQIIRVLI